MVKWENNRPEVYRFSIFLYEPSPSHSSVDTDTENKGETVYIRKNIVCEETKI